MLRRAYENSLLVLGAYEDERLVGVIRAVGDGYSVLFIQDLLVFPEYQRRGIGTRLLREVMERYPHVYQLELMTDNTPLNCLFLPLSRLCQSRGDGMLWIYENEMT